MITVLVTCKTKPKFKQAFMEGFTEIASIVRKEKGCIRYDLSISSEDESVLYVTELWDSQVNFQAHLDSEHMAQFFVESQIWLDTLEIKTYESTEFNR